LNDPELVPKEKGKNKFVEHGTKGPNISIDQQWAKHKEMYYFYPG